MIFKIRVRDKIGGPELNSGDKQFSRDREREQKLLETMKIWVVFTDNARDRRNASAASSPPTTTTSAYGDTHLTTLFINFRESMTNSFHRARKNTANEDILIAG